MAQPSARTFTIQDNLINLPPTVILVRAIPSQLRVKLERRVYKEILVTLAFEEDLPANLKIVSTEISPAQIKVVGPESRITLATSIATEPITIKDMAASAPIRVNVLLTDPELSIVGSSLVTVKLQTTQLP